MRQVIPAQPAEARCPRALASVYGAESPARLQQARVLLLPANITFTITIIITIQRPQFQARASTPGVSVESESSAPRGRAPDSSGALPGGRAEASARQVVQDWAQACNTRHIDDLLELYSADATLIRSSVPPVRSLPAIREFLISLLEAGLGDVEMESLRLEIMGEIALDLGRCKMLVPIAMGKRREERGKYLIVLVRQPVGTWKILADCWSADLAVSLPPEPAPAARKGNEPAPPVRKSR